MIPFCTAGSCYILMYHSIADDTEDPYAVAVKSFHAQVSWLAENGFSFVPLSFLVKLIKDKNYRELNNKVAFTFDDGCLDFATNALPVLTRHEATATVFIVTEMLGGKSTWNMPSKSVPMLSENEIRHLQTQNMNFGSHTASHVNLPLLNDKELYRQLSNSYQLLFDLGESFYSLSYPWGQWSPRVVKSVKSTGYECALLAGESVMRLYKNDPYLLPRVAMNGNMDFESFKSVFTQSALSRILKRYSRVLIRRLSCTAS